jgi:Tol biopolymer transport system component
MNWPRRTILMTVLRRMLYSWGWAVHNDRAVTTAPHSDHRWPAWSPDGAYIVFARRTADSQELSGELVKAFDIGILRADGTGPLHNLTNRYTGHDMMPHL